jgi:hypothetical protein
MDLTELLYQPYIISILIALIFTFIVYLILKRNNDKKKQEQPYSKTLTITFFCSFIGFLGLIYGMKHLSNTKTEIMSGGGGNISVSDLSEKLNIAGGDVDFDLLDN